LQQLRKRLENHPAWARALPFLIFLTLTLLQGRFGQESAYWIYLAKTIVGAWLVWLVWPLVAEMRWRVGWDALLVGVAVCVVWVAVSRGLATQEGIWMAIGIADGPVTPASEWNPFLQFADAPAIAWFFVAVRVIGSGVVVPPIEEAFYRSFVYRWLADPEFTKVPLNVFAWRPFVITAFIFGFAHNEWLAGILCGLAYQWLVIRHGRLGEAMTAHAVTNILLAGWVVAADEWRFW